MTAAKQAKLPGSCQESTTHLQRGQSCLAFLAPHGTSKGVSNSPRPWRSHHHKLALGAGQACMDGGGSGAQGELVTGESQAVGLCKERLMGGVAGRVGCQWGGAAHKGMVCNMQALQKDGTP